MADVFTCPNCGSDVRVGAASCRECGADAETGWSDETYLDGLDLPDDEFSEAQQGQGIPIWMTVLGLVLIALMLALVIP